jgi:hypothetical protein
MDIGMDIYIHWRHTHRSRQRRGVVTVAIGDAGEERRHDPKQGEEWAHDPKCAQLEVVEAWAKV